MRNRFKNSGSNPDAKEPSGTNTTDSFDKVFLTYSRDRLTRVAANCGRLAIRGLPVIAPVNRPKPESESNFLAAEQSLVLGQWESLGISELGLSCQGMAFNRIGHWSF